jgi:hypothetical protein
MTRTIPMSPRRQSAAPRRPGATKTLQAGAPLGFDTLAEALAAIGNEMDADSGPAPNQQRGGHKR